MDALLIASGILAALVAWVWLVVTARALGIGAMLLAVFLPLLTLLPGRRGYALMPRLLLLLGLLLMLAGGTWLQRNQPERFDSLMAGDWLGSDAAQGRLQGELMGQRFVPDRAYWANNELVLAHVSGEKVRRSLTIRFADTSALLRSRRLERLPGDQVAGPELVLQWYAGALNPPGLRRVIDGYTLSLEFSPQADGRTRVSIHLHLPSQDSTRMTGDVWLEETPAWLQALELASARPAPALAAMQSSEAPALELPSAPPPAEWQAVSLLALLDEPELFLGQNLRLTTVTARIYEGRLKAVSDDQRVVLAQPRGANQVDYHFHPLDIRRLEVRYRSTR